MMSAWERGERYKLDVVVLGFCLYKIQDSKTQTTINISCRWIGNASGPSNEAYSECTIDVLLLYIR
jgi:hypothetical protein